MAYRPLAEASAEPPAAEAAGALEELLEAAEPVVAALEALEELLPVEPETRSIPAFLAGKDGPLLRRNRL